MPWTEVIASAMRHLEAIRLGEDIDEESGLLHAAHLQCNAAMLTEYYFTKQDFDNRKKYIGIDIRKQTIEAAKEKFKPVEWAEFYDDDLIFPSLNYKDFQGDKVCSFEVAEHVGKQNIDAFLINMRDCGNENATYYISTPNYDEKVGAAGNHTYDSGDGRGVAIHEFSHNELQQNIEKYFIIQRKFGTFASIKDYKHLLNEWQVKMFESLKEYYDSNLLSVIMAPFFPEQSRNTLWILKRK